MQFQKLKFQNKQQLQSIQYESCLFCYSNKDQNVEFNQINSPSTQFVLRQYIQKQQNNKKKQQVNLFLKLNQSIHKKYINNSNFYHTNVIDIIIHHSQQNLKKQLNHNINYQNTAIINYYQIKKRLFNQKQYIEQYIYNQNQQNTQKLVQLAQYYKFHQNFPRIHVKYVQQIVSKYHHQKREYQYKRVKNYLQKEKGLSISSFSQSSSIQNSSFQNSNNEKQEQNSDNFSNVLDQLNDIKKRKNDKRKKKTSSKRQKNCIAQPLNICQIKISDSSDSLLLKQICEQIDVKFKQDKKQKQWSIRPTNYYLNLNNFEKFLKKQETKARLKRMGQKTINHTKIWRKIIQKQSPYQNKYLMFQQKIIKKLQKEKNIPKKFLFNQYEIINEDANINIKDKNQQTISKQIQINLKTIPNPQQQHNYIFNNELIWKKNSKLSSQKQTNFRITQSHEINQKKSARPFSSNYTNRKTYKQQKNKEKNFKFNYFKRSASAHHKEIKISKTNLKILQEKAIIKSNNFKKRLSSFKEFLTSQKLVLEAKRQNLLTNQNLKVKKCMIFQQKPEKSYNSSLLKYKSTFVAKSSNSPVKPKQNAKNKIVKQLINKKLTIYPRQTKIK